MKLYLDFETRSRADLPKVGAWAYASHPSTDIICMGWAFGDDPVNTWKGPRDNKRPHFFFKSEDVIVAHNVVFEYAIYHFVLHKKYGWPKLLDPARWDCTMARALMCGLPASLEGLALALKLPFKKDLSARSALLKICKPNPGEGTWNEDPALYETVYKYNIVDVEVERAADKALPELPPRERRVFEADLRINRRGILLDLGAATKARDIAAGLTNDLNGALRRLTNGAVSKASRVAELKRWVVSQGVAIPTRSKIDKETNEEEIKETLDIEAVKDLFNDPKTPDIVKRVIAIRQQVGKSSVSKLKTMLLCACADGRFRGAFQYHGSHTGRWAGRLLQLEIFPQGLVGEEKEFAIATLDSGVGFFRATFDEKSLQTLSDILRGMLIPAPGKVFIGVDLNAIECRVLNWLAGEEWVLDLFARGESPYVRMAEAIYEKKGITKKGNLKEYEIGKRAELGGGFGMGWVRFQGSTYTETTKRGEGVFLEDELAQKIIKTYRSLHRKVVEFWYETEGAAVRAVQNPGQLFSTAGGRVLWGMSADRRFLSAKLPSGRLLRYFRPSVVQGKNKKGEPKPELRYWSSIGEGAIRSDCNGMLGEYRTWGGELIENVVQAVARDVIVNDLDRIESAGFPIVLHAHDEFLAEVDPKRVDPEHGLAAMIGYMSVTPKWAPGLTIKAEGFIARRYRK